jgi:hypothetical protein
VVRRAAVDFLAQLPNEDVDRAIPVGVPPSPERLEELVSRDDPAAIGASACKSRNSVGVRSTLSPPTNACTTDGSIRSSSIPIASPRSAVTGRAPRRAAARTRATSSSIENGFTM